MHCFNHSDAEAVGICKVCQKGLCRTCAADLGHSLACKDKHEAQAQAFHELVTRNVRVQATAGKSKYVAPIFFGFMGVVFLTAGMRDETPGISLTTYMGLGFIAFAAFCFVANRRAYATSSGDPS